jgi:hypothetical protein
MEQDKYLGRSRQLHGESKQAAAWVAPARLAVPGDLMELQVICRQSDSAECTDEDDPQGGVGARAQAG